MNIFSDGVPGPPRMLQVSKIHYDASLMSFVITITWLNPTGKHNDVTRAPTAMEKQRGNLESEPRRDEEKEVELGSRGWLAGLIVLLLSCSSIVTILDTVFATLLCMVVETAISGAHELLHTGVVPTSLKEKS